MKNFKIKIIKETPLHSVGTTLEIEEFKKMYPLMHIDSSNDFLYKHINNYSKLLEFFSFVPISPKFKIGDWVWNENINKAFEVVEYYENMKPNEATLEAVNLYTDIYIRFATVEEIEFHKTTMFGFDILIGKHRCYYFKDFWHELKGIKPILEFYFNANRCIPSITGKEIKWFSTLNGLNIGCKQFTHKQLLEIHNLL